ncbi:AlwI restriction endonuclease [Chlamydia trachomatis]|nr:AlwI restriction endonuclease [Chlamydia trachomatis]
MRTLSELGFVYAVFNEKFELSPIANALINNEIDEQTAFANQATIYNRRSPYRNVSNDYNYFKFITKILIER